MSENLDQQLGFAPDYDSPVPYMKRTRDYYIAIGYTTPYRWAHYVEAPFQPLKKPLELMPLSPFPSWPDYIINMCGYEFRKGQLTQYSAAANARKQADAAAGEADAAVCQLWAA